MTSLAYPGRLRREDPDLSDRLRDLFLTVVSLHGRTARPVASEALAREAGIRLSPASIRNDLAELEVLGLLEREHASAGRIPSAAGYEFLVRGLLPPARLTQELVDRIEHDLQRSARDVEALLREASRLLSTVTEQLGLAVARSLDDDRLRRLDLDRLDDQRVVMVLGLEGGAAQTVVLELETPLDPSDLADVAPVLRERLLGLSLSEVREALRSDAELIRRSAVRLVVRAASEQWSDGVETSLISAGASRIAQQPEFARADRLGPILRAVETGRPLERLLVSGVEGHASVRVGIDASPGLESCSLVSFALPGQVRGAVGVLGPVRMNYSMALAVVDHVGARVAELLQA